MKFIIDDEEFLNLEIPQLKKSGLVENAGKSGRVEGSKNLTQIEKEIIGIDGAVSGVKQSEIAKTHGITQEQVSTISRGYNTSAIDVRKVDDELKSTINQAKFNIADKATSKLMTMLDLFRPDVLEQSEIPSAALKLASVQQKMFDKIESTNGPSVQFVVVVPEITKEDKYPVIEVGD